MPPLLQSYTFHFFFFLQIELYCFSHGFYVSFPLLEQLRLPGSGITGSYGQVAGDSFEIKKNATPQEVSIAVTASVQVEHIFF